MSRLPLLARHFRVSVLALFVFPAGSLLVAPVIIHPTGYSAKHLVAAGRERTRGVNVAKSGGRRLCVEEIGSCGQFPRGNVIERQSRTNGGMVGTTSLLMSFSIPKIALGLPGVWIGTGTTDTKNHNLGSSLKTGNSSAPVAIAGYDGVKEKSSLGCSADSNVTSHVSNVGARRTVNATGSTNFTLPVNTGDTEVHGRKTKASVKNYVVDELASRRRRPRESLVHHGLFRLQLSRDRGWRQALMHFSICTLPICFKFDCPPSHFSGSTTI